MLFTTSLQLPPSNGKSRSFTASTLALLSDFVRIHGYGRVVDEAERVISSPSLLPVQKGKPTELLARKTLAHAFGDLNDAIAML